MRPQGGSAEQRWDAGVPIQGSSGWSELSKTMVVPTHLPSMGGYRHHQTRLQGLNVQENV